MRERDSALRAVHHRSGPVGRWTQFEARSFWRLIHEPMADLNKGRMSRVGNPASRIRVRGEADVDREAKPAHSVADDRGCVKTQKTEKRRE